MTGNRDDVSAETTGIASDVSFLDGATDRDDNGVGGESTDASGVGGEFTDASGVSGEFTDASINGVGVADGFVLRLIFPCTGSIGTTCCNGSTRSIVAAWSDIDTCEVADSAGVTEVLIVSSNIGDIGAAIAGMSDRG
jgi:hypothetical protein